MTKEEILAAIPQQEPFRFIDRILELDEDHVVATYRYREDADFYRGHFPSRPITPGVILIETMAQAAVVALGLYLLHREDPDAKITTLFSHADVEFAGIVLPGTEVTTSAKKVFYRRRTLRVSAEMRLPGGSLVCAGTLSGTGVPL